MQIGKQTGRILLDFSKAFDKVAHEKILLKPHHYVIRRGTLKIKDFLDNRKQATVINGKNSDKKSQSPLASRRAQFSAQFSCLAHINELPEQVKSRVRLFADDTALYLSISSTTESEVYKQT